MQKYLGKIASIKFGIAGYQECMLGLSIDFSFDDSSSISEFKGYWDYESIKCSGGSKWTEQDRDNSMIGLMKFISRLLKEAKVDDITKLKGIPVEVCIENRTLKSWRILTEVL